ncbi:MAG TPA: UdgX family uracil-DNA binding protein [Kaistia sp.]|nr:UdgX family uracil-DNA binding protein [Kaistia sp.]
MTESLFPDPPVRGTAPADAAERLAAAAEEARHCRRCPLYRDATQVVFGEGAIGASMMLVGEQPGDQEDIAGRPFVGPAGKLLDRALADAGIDRSSVYVSNAVKHFKYEMRGKRRLHKSPNRGEVEACRWWLAQELDLVRPHLVVALGATAAQALMRRTVVLSREGGRALVWADGSHGLATIHPSAVLRQRDEPSRAEAYDGLVRGLIEAARLAAG